MKGKKKNITKPDAITACQQNCHASAEDLYKDQNGSQQVGKTGVMLQCLFVSSSVLLSKGTEARIYAALMFVSCEATVLAHPCTLGSPCWWRNCSGTA